MTRDEKFMHRAIQLARRGRGYTGLNPCVGCVITDGDRLLGEGWHAEHGGPHAEIQAIRAISVQDHHRLSQSTLYVSLEPCAHRGKTPPCVNRILTEKIPRVVIAHPDPTALAGGGADILRAAGVEITERILIRGAKSIILPWLSWQNNNRPYVILKWAQTLDGYIGRRGEQVSISGALAQRFTHQLRRQVDAILIGAATVLTARPELTDRFHGGPQPRPLAWIHPEDIPQGHPFHERTDIVYRPVGEKRLEEQIVETARLHNISSILIEGGAHTHQAFIEADLWDEAYILESDHSIDGMNIPAATWDQAYLIDKRKMGSDTLYHYSRTQDTELFPI